MKDWNNLIADENLILTKHYTPGRAGQRITKVVLHHNGGNLSIKGCWQVWQTRQASAHYQVDANGRIGQLVHDKDTAWHAGNLAANRTSIGIEHADISNSPWRISDATLENGAHLTAAICRFYGLGRPQWGVNVFGHKAFSSTECLPVGKTELLTKHGWVSLSDVSAGDEVASYRLDDGAIIFSPVRHVVEPYIRDTWEMRDVEMTANHRMVWRNQCNREYRITDAASMVFPDNGQVYIPNAGHYTGSGLELSDAELELLIAIQADGSYMRDRGRVTGIEFHFSKQRKIDAVMDLLESLNIDYRINRHTNGTTSIRIYDTTIVEWTEQWLSDKQFTWKFLDMDDHQAEVFLDKILDYDGCRAGNDYSSFKVQNIDVVQALAALHDKGTRTANNRQRLCFGNRERTIHTNGGLKRTAQRHSRQLVSCVTVDTGIILIRQHGRTSIVGNCPASIAGNQNAAYMARAQAWYDAMGKGTTPPVVSPSTPSTNTGGITVDGYWGKATTLKLQQVLGAPYKDGLISRQNPSWKGNCPACTGGWEWKLGRGGSQTISLVQQRIGATPDGLIGPNTINKLIQYFKADSGATLLDGRLDAESITIKAMQRRLNTGKF